MLHKRGFVVIVVMVVVVVVVVIVVVVVVVVVVVGRGRELFQHLGGTFTCTSCVC